MSTNKCWENNFASLLPMPCNSLSQRGSITFQCISLDLPAIGPIMYSLFTQLRRITTLMIAMGGGSYFLKRGVRKKGGSREPPEPPLATGLASYG